jgi:hypothetical protein
MKTREAMGIWQRKGGYSVRHIPIARFFWNGALTIIDPPSETGDAPWNRYPDVECLRLPLPAPL